MMYWNPWKGLGNLPREVWILFAVTLVNRAGTMVLPFLTLYLTKKLGFSPSQAGMMISLYGLGALAAAPVSGLLCDRFGPLRILRFSLFSSGLVMLLASTARALPAVGASVALLAFTTELLRPASMAATSMLVSAETRKPAFSLNRLAINLGMSVGPVVGGLLATVSFESLFVVDASTTLIAGVILAVSRFPSLALASLSGGVTVRTPARQAFSDTRMMYFLAAEIPIAIVFFQHISVMPLFLVQYLKLPESVYGLSFTVNTLMIVFLEVPFNLATARWSHRLTLVMGTLFCTIGFGAYGLVTGAWNCMLPVVIWTIGEMILFPGMAAYVAHIAPPERQGHYMGLYQMAFSIAFVIGPWAGTELFEMYGGRLIWLLVFLCGMVSVLMLSRLRR